MVCWWTVAGQQAEGAVGGLAAIRRWSPVLLGARWDELERYGERTRVSAGSGGSREREGDGGVVVYPGVKAASVWVGR